MCVPVNKKSATHTHTHTYMYIKERLQYRKYQTKKTQKGAYLPSQRWMMNMDNNACYVRNTHGQLDQVPKAPKIACEIVMYTFMCTFV